MAVRLFVGNLSYATTEADLRTYFGTVAPPSQVVLPVDRETGRPRGFAFVEYHRAVARRAGDSAVQRPGVQRTAARGQRGARARGSRTRRPRGRRAVRARGPAAFAPGRPRRSAGRPPVRSVGPAPPPQPQLRPRREAPTRRQRQGEEKGRRAPARSDSAQGTGRSFTLDDDPLDEPLADIDDFATSKPQEDVDKDADTEGDKDKKEEERTRNEKNKAFKQPDMPDRKLWDQVLDQVAGRSDTGRDPALVRRSHAGRRHRRPG